MRDHGGRDGVGRGRRRTGRPSLRVRVAAVVYVAALGAVTLAPIHWTLGPARQPRNLAPQLVPFDGILADVADAPVETLAELFGNVLLFAPFGLLLPRFVPAMRRWWRVLAAGAGVSLCIELYQLAWPGVRKASVNDVLLNALGTLLGFAALRRSDHPRGRSRPVPRSATGPTGPD
jgi:glycopeptide antibiotics resistance protein